MIDVKEKLFSDAHTTYSFTGEPVTDTQLTEIYDLVEFAPTPMNTQALRIEFVRTPEGKGDLFHCSLKEIEPKARARAPLPSSHSTPTSTTSCQNTSPRYPMLVSFTLMTKNGRPVRERSRSCKRVTSYWQSDQLVWMRDQ